jgi:hypothetical protein
MNVVVCGPESSGTTIMARVVRDYIVVPVVHRSMPHLHDWWDWRDYPGRYVIIVRRADLTVRSQEARQMPHAGAESWHRAMAMLAQIPDAYWVSYEALVAAPQRQADNVARWLGVTPQGVMPQIVDANAKWLAAA